MTRNYIPGHSEVTTGGVDTNELSSKTMESKKTPGLYFVGEVVDVTGWLGGYNLVVVQLHIPLVVVAERWRRWPSLTLTLTQNYFDLFILNQIILTKLFYGYSFY